MSETPEESNKGPTRSLMRLCAAVDLILEAVEEATTSSPGPAPRDMNDAFLGAAYGRAYRCLRSIRELAYRGDGDDAMILTRSLLSVVARSLYLVEPQPEEADRKNRLASWRFAYAKEAIRTFDDLAATGFVEPDEERERLTRIAELESAAGTTPFPNDRDLLAGLGLAVYYARIYRVTSDVVHYSVGSALDGFVEYPKNEGGGSVSLKKPDSDRAEEALSLAAIVYGEFLERSEPVIRHGVTPLARRLLVEYLNAQSSNEDNEAKAGD
jgi:Family of unknown function (DUF5677)